MKRRNVAAVAAGLIPAAAAAADVTMERMRGMQAKAGRARIAGERCCRGVWQEPEMPGKLCESLPAPSFSLVKHLLAS